MYIVTKILQLTVLLIASLTLHIISWIPSLLIENIVNFSIVGFFIAAGYVVYLIAKRLHHAQKKRNVYKSTAYTLLLFVYMGFFAIIQIGVSIGKSQYIQTYEFGDVTFYTYQTTTGATEVSRKEDPLPIRTLPIALFPYTDISLKKEENYIYAVGDEIEVKIYDLKNNIVFENLKNKEKND